MRTPKQLLASRSGREKIADVSSLILVIVMAAAAMLPIWWIFRSSLMTNTELYAFPPAFFPSEWRFSNYIETLETYDFWLYLKNTMVIIVPSVFGVTVTATLCGYAFARLRFRGKKFLFTLCIGSMLLPNMVTLLPLYLMWTRIFHLGQSVPTAGGEAGPGGARARVRLSCHRLRLVQSRGGTLGYLHGGLRGLPDALPPGAGRRRKGHPAGRDDPWTLV